MASALEGIKVIDVSQVAAVPVAARHLADFGAEVIHVENPATGDFWRTYQAGQGRGTAGVPSDINYNWENFNRNKRSLTLDLSLEGGQKILYKMAETADVFLTNLRPFELERYHLEYATLSQKNPRLVYGSLTGFGKKGPERNAPAYDATAYWGRSGVPYMMSTMAWASPGFRPAFGDNVAGLALALGVMLALFARERTGLGQEIDLNLVHIGIYQIAFDIAGALVTGRDFAEWRIRSREEVPNPLALPYPTKDGRTISLVVLQPDRYWSRFCQAIRRTDLEHDPKFETYDARFQNRAELLHILDEVFLTRTLEEWKPRLEGIPFAPIQTLLEVINDPQTRANDTFVPFDHPTHGRIEVVANPVKLSKTPATVRMPAPEFGQHTEEVLLEYGYSWEDIEQFKQQRIIA
jgi:crotonobetainyl-CoA:carnitine CoA-transferase CaiB-like acyl-CoA transferase